MGRSMGLSNVTGAAHIKNARLGCLRRAENRHNRLAGFRRVQITPGARPATAARPFDKAASPFGAEFAPQPGKTA
jgi:DNA helicase II / ATP-dependent DNA helicase PcrA